MLLREIFIGGARAPPAPPHATALDNLYFTHGQFISHKNIQIYKRALNG